MRILLGYLLIFGLYFSVKLVMFLPLEIVPGTVKYIGTAERGYSGRYGYRKNIISFPVATFRVKENDADTGELYTTKQEEVLSFRNYQPGTEVKIAYNPTHIEDARFYSAAEYWVPLANMLVLFFTCLAWTAGYYFVRRFVTQGR